jgi:hypothetical protein
MSRERLNFTSSILVSNRIFDGLRQLPPLKSVNLTGCQVSEQQLQRFRESRPDCNVIR